VLSGSAFGAKGELGVSKVHGRKFSAGWKISPGIFFTEISSHYSLARSAQFCELQFPISRPRKQSRW
jgi:hypothetical protein